jgi:hypothetical protein
MYFENCLETITQNPFITFIKTVGNHLL